MKYPILSLAGISKEKESGRKKGRAGRGVLAVASHYRGGGGIREKRKRNQQAVI